MTGRHRQRRTTGAQRALVSAVPVLGLAGVVTALGSSDPVSTPNASGSDVETAPASLPVVLTPEGAGRDPALTGVANDASRAADDAETHQRAEERRAIVSVVDDVRDDARAREDAAARQGQQQLDEFRQEQAQQQEQQRQDRARELDQNSRPAPDDRSVESCDLTGSPRIGIAADPHEIVGRDCGIVGLFGENRSTDPWIDGQLLDAGDD